MSTWLITGISRGLGRALAEAALARGHVVVGTTRTGTADFAPQPEGLHVVPFRAESTGHAQDAVARAISLTGRLDVVVNNAGYGLLGPVEATSDAEALALFDTDLMGVLRVTRAALPHLRASGGHVVNVSSVAALDPLPDSAVYAGAKAAVTAMSEGLAREVRRFGVGVTVVGLGAFRTDFLSATSIRHTENVIDAYQDESADGGHFAAMAGKQSGDPRRAAELIVDAVDSGRAPLHLVVGADAVARARTRTEAFLADVASWEARSVATAYDAR